VHRARLKSGEEVAVKIQYPDIARTIRDDFKNLSLLLLPLRFTEGWESLRVQLEDVREMLERETDYQAEAQATKQAREHLADLPEIVGPARLRAALDRARADHRVPALARTSRSSCAATRARSSATASAACSSKPSSGSSTGTISCGPTRIPATSVFLDDGRLGLIDFGSVRVFDEEELRCVRLLERALRGDEVAYEEACASDAGRKRRRPRRRAIATRPRVLRVALGALAPARHLRPRQRLLPARCAHLRRDAAQALHARRAVTPGSTHVPGSALDLLPTGRAPSTCTRSTSARCHAAARADAAARRSRVRRPPERSGQPDRWRRARDSPC
jgi:hypothetical protein